MSSTYDKIKCISWSHLTPRRELIHLTKFLTHTYQSLQLLLGEAKDQSPQSLCVLPEEDVSPCPHGAWCYSPASFLQWSTSASGSSTFPAWFCLRSGGNTASHIQHLLSVSSYAWTWGERLHRNLTSHTAVGVGEILICFSRSTHLTSILESIKLRISSAPSKSPTGVRC